MEILNILDKQGIPYKRFGEHHHATKNRIQLDCPFCSQGTNRFRLGFNIIYHYFSCWSCGRLPIKQTLAEIFGDSSKEILKLLEKEEAQNIPKDKKSQSCTLPKKIGPLENVHINYLVERGFNPKLIEKIWRILGIKISVNLSWRIFIPVHYQNKTLSWTTRSISDNTKAKYISAPNIKSFLYGHDLINHSVILCEGPLDVWKIGPGAIASFGFPTRSQIIKVSKYPKRFICFDNEKDAQERARKAVEFLEVFPGETYNIILDSKDPGEATKKEIRLLRKLLL